MEILQEIDMYHLEESSILQIQVVASQSNVSVRLGNITCKRSHRASIYVLPLSDKLNNNFQIESACAPSSSMSWRLLGNKNREMARGQAKNSHEKREPVVVKIRKILSFKETINTKLSSMDSAWQDQLWAFYAMEYRVRNCRSTENRLNSHQGHNPTYLCNFYILKLRGKMRRLLRSAS